MQRFNLFEMISRESIEQMEIHFLKITIDLFILQKVIPQIELNTKVFHALPKGMARKNNIIERECQLQQHHNRILILQVEGSWI